jgi:hypothetical protein
MSWVGALAPWLPTFLVLILSALAVALVGTAPPRAARWWGMSTIVLLGGLAVAATVWQARSVADQLNANLVEAEHVNALEDQLGKMKQSIRRRTISADTAAKLADYLRPFGMHKVVVSCSPDDIEAYHYATEIVNVLKSASWDARGPETTTIFGDIKSMAINVYDNGSRSGSDTTGILLAGLTKSGIPYQSRVPPSEALPEGETVELFIGAKPSQTEAPGATEAGH